MISLLSAISFLCCLYFIRREIKSALLNVPYSIFSVIVFLTVIYYYLIPLFLFEVNPSGPWRFMAVVGDSIQTLDLYLASLMIFVAVIVLGLSRFSIKPLSFSSLFRRTSFLYASQNSRLFKISFYSICFVAVLLYSFSIHAAGGIHLFLSLGKLLKTGDSDLSYQSLIARYFTPIIFYVLICLSVWATNFYKKRLFLLWLMIIVGFFMALSSGSRGQIIGFLLSNLYVFVIYKLAVSRLSFNRLISPLRLYSANTYSAFLLSKKKFVLYSLALVLLFILFAGLPYLKAFIWTLPVLTSGESIATFIDTIFAKYTYLTEGKSVSKDFIDGLILFYSAQDHQLASYLLFWTDLVTPHFANHQLDVFESVKSLIAANNAGFDTPSTYFQRILQPYTLDDIGRIPPYFLAASLYYHTFVLYLPALGLVFYLLCSFDLFVSKMRESILCEIANNCSLKAYAFVWACISPVVLFNYLFFPDWFMSIYKLLPFLLFSLPMTYLLLLGGRSRNLS